MSDQAECRNCGMKLKGEPYFRGKPAYHPKTNERCLINFYGGFVCSEMCDREATRKMEASIDNHNDPGGYYRKRQP